MQFLKLKIKAIFLLLFESKSFILYTGTNQLISHTDIDTGTLYGVASFLASSANEAEEQERAVNAANNILNGIE